MIDARRILQPYQTYKPSGIEWLEDVPTHWEVRRLKTLSDRVHEWHYAIHQGT